MAGVLAGITLSTAESAQALERELSIQFAPPEDAQVDGYRIYLAEGETGIEQTIDLGFVPADADGVARTNAVVDAAVSYAVSMAAYNAAGESPRSNTVQVSATSCDPAACDDGDPCTLDSCDLSGCISSIAPDGARCDDGYADTVDDQCVMGRCVGSLVACAGDVDCDDGDVCNGIEVCDGGRECLAGTPLDCGEPTACEDPVCDPKAGCLMLARVEGSPCDDGRADTSGDQCVSGVCIGEVVSDAPDELLLSTLTPDTVSFGSVVLELHGQGFAEGLSLRFEKGKGRPPVVRSVQWLDGSMALASIEIRRKGGKSGQRWDAVVSLPSGAEARLSDALEVTR